jgi:hypothetical protein
LTKDPNLSSSPNPALKLQILSVSKSQHVLPELIRVNNGLSPSSVAVSSLSILTSALQQSSQKKEYLKNPLELTWA